MSTYEEVMGEEELAEAHNVYQQYDSLVIAIGNTLLKNLNIKQQDYVLVKMHEEFRFWRVLEPK